MSAPHEVRAGKGNVRPAFGFIQQSGVERAIMQAIDGDGIGALPLLRRAMVRCPNLTRQRGLTRARGVDAEDYVWAAAEEVVIDQSGT